MNIANFSGKIVSPEDHEYEQARKTIGSTGTPVVVLYPYNSSDVVAALEYTKNNSLLLSVRSGGHSVAGFASNTNGVVLDLSSINTIEIKDNQVVRLGTGARWGDVAKTLGEKNLAISSGDTKSVGVGGLILGGGIGWMVRKYGLTIDSLIGADIVTADGKLFHASETENADLFWAIRGGGGNFGVVTHVEIQAHASGPVYAGMIMFTLDNLPELLKGWRDYMRSADEALTTILNVFPSFGGNPPGAMLTSCYAGDEATGIKALEPLRKLGKVVMDNVKMKPYAEVLEEAHPPEGIKIVVKNTFVESFSDEVIDAIVTAHTANPNIILQIRSLTGAMNRVGEEATAFGHRKSEVMLLSPTFLAPNATEEDIKKGLEPWNSIAKFGKGAYSGFLSTATEEDIQQVYPPATFDRLKKIKQQYDPHNLFNQNFNVKP